MGEKKSRKRGRREEAGGGGREGVGEEEASVGGCRKRLETRASELHRKSFMHPAPSSYPWGHRQTPRH